MRTAIAFVIFNHLIQIIYRPFQFVRNGHLTKLLKIQRACIFPQNRIHFLLTQFALHFHKSCAVNITARPCPIFFENCEPRLRLLHNGNTIHPTMCGHLFRPGGQAFYNPMASDETTTNIFPGR